MDHPDALQFWDFRVNIKVKNPVHYFRGLSQFLETLLGHYRYNNSTWHMNPTEELVETNAQRDADIYHVIISGHKEQDALGEDTFVLNFRMGSHATLRRMMDGAINIFVRRLWRTRYRAQFQTMYRSTVTTYGHRDSGSGGEMTYRFGGGNSRPSDDPPSVADIVRKRLFFFYVPRVDAGNIEDAKGIIDRLKQSAAEVSDGNFVRGVHWMGQPVEVFLENMGSNNYAILFRVLESSLDGHDINDVLGTLEGQTKDYAYGSGSILFEEGDWVISPLGPIQNDTTRWDDNRRRARRFSTEFFETDAIPQQTTNLQTDDSNPQTRPTEVELGAEFSLEEFQNLGPFYIPEKLFFDNLTQDDDIDYGCSIRDLAENIEYPVLVTTKVNGKEFQKIYCAEEIARWIGEMGKTEDPLRAPIVRIHIMTKEEVVAKEKALVEDKKKELNETLAKLRGEKASIGKIRALNHKIAQFTYENLKNEREKKRIDAEKEEKRIDAEKEEKKRATERHAKRRRLSVMDISLRRLKF